MLYPKLQMSELAESKDLIDRKRIENRKLLDAAELVVFALPIPDKAKLLCLYFLRTCDWLALTRDEGREALAQMLGCSEDQVSRYTRPLDEAGILRIVARGSNLNGRVHSYRIGLEHPFWTGDQDEVKKVSEELFRSANKSSAGKGKASRTRHKPNSAIAEPGQTVGRARPPEQPISATEMAEHAALPLLPPSSPSPPLREVGGEIRFQPYVLPDLPVLDTKVTDKELAELVRTHGLVRPADLINKFPQSASWSSKLRREVDLALSGKYYFEVFDGKYDTCRPYCPDDRTIILKILMNLVGEAPEAPMSLAIKHLYPKAWPAASTGDLAVDEEKAALDWLKAPDRSGTCDDFLNKMRQQVLSGRPLSPKQRDAVIRNWKAAVGR